MTAKKMSADELRQALRNYTAFLIKERDEFAAAHAEYGFEGDKAHAAAHRLSLSVLSIYTDGEFGEARPVNPKPAAEADGGAES